MNLNIVKMRPMLEILAKRPGAPTLRTIYHACTDTRIDALQFVRKAYQQALTILEKSEFDPFLRYIGGETHEVEWEDTNVKYNIAQFNFFTMMIENHAIKVIFIFRKELEEEQQAILAKAEKRRQDARKKRDSLNGGSCAL